MSVFIVLGLLACGGQEPVNAAAEVATEVAAAPAASEGEQKQEEVKASELGADWTHYGAAFSLPETTSASALLADPSKFHDQTVRVTGRVTDVCQKAGCWMVIAEEEKLLRVVMKDHSFAVNKQGAGGEADIEGVVVAKAVDAKEIEHYKGESERPDQIPEDKVEGTMTYELVAASVSMRKSTTN